jgi:hypothetical protein
MHAGSSLPLNKSMRTRVGPTKKCLHGLMKLTQSGIQGCMDWLMSPKIAAVQINLKAISCDLLKF